jgi:hypothetical protein
MGACTVKAMDTGRVGDEDRIGAADEEAALYHANDAPDAFFQSRRISDPAEVAIENAIAAVGNEGLASGQHAQPGAGAEHFKRLPGCFQSEDHDLNRNGCLHTQSIDELGSVNDDYKTVACGSYDLLVQQCSAQPLDQIECVALNLVRAVDREIDLPMLAERSKWNARRRRLGRRPL